MTTFPTAPQFSRMPTIVSTCPSCGDVLVKSSTNYASCPRLCPGKLVSTVQVRHKRKVFDAQVASLPAPTKYRHRRFAKSEGAK